MDRLPKLIPLAQLSRELELPYGWLKDRADAGDIPSLIINKRKRLFNRDAVGKRLMQLASEMPERTGPRHTAGYGCD